MSKKVTNEELARMMAKGFEDMATKEDLKTLATKQDLEDLTLKFDNVAFKFEVKDLERRVDVLERKVSVK
ncbi:MAG: hypothetical protein A3J07_01395 [Candidatus Doudnabacteria bacterium RIFCSPLOWO2_02_FULL_49_13]|uniref:Uncharacterized protein n=1 Tax=Candidatus Doudnabacteria bacterium RIFCSPHIGHO2_12_FULL_48_16 TaxID=1817838 RepID=A0A1F5PL11_9BACT|nr:MAG: hypothetical protein A3B77_04320 [Candidatus Doudnabacteria bacterium RIFCSPHIGHO2_02_FULL_49_24]OGE88705.1 MAG: hypothetical protein A2760_01980 [Candidatus Doudnabacteria bacterium RIFCSPHIGHO2_01_FULL_50_67]OGE90390.1 MAG: hypothetical protein A3E29_04900 [Candidatus Doudnabacteria bacterium RIFCSPHIGHO2_12_FULL_48_16]OGE97097.1 MAG: hypothetical protein A2990_01890 [Candidatus Doudnabacteria bacterium RIFCSPLOWO2_01_FULL_49_40]OGF02445.1 MAG: hypothetical protein A3J07_01395 [Candid